MFCLTPLNSLASGMQRHNDPVQVSITLSLKIGNKIKLSIFIPVDKVEKVFNP
jgi:hypothetical protein